MTKYLEELDQDHRPHRAGADTEQSFDTAARDTKQRERDVERLGAHRRTEYGAKKVPFSAWVVLAGAFIVAVHHFYTF